MSTRSRWRAACFTGAGALLLVSFAYLVPAELEVDLGGGLRSAIVSENFHQPEGAHRWSRGQSEIVFPDPGGTRAARVELVLSGFRPPGASPPSLVIEAGGERLQLQPSRRIEPYHLETRIEGGWSSTLRVRLRAETFTPGGGDQRALGVRLHRARLVLDGPALVSWKQLLASVSLVVLSSLLLGGSRSGVAASLALGALLAAGYAFLRIETAFLVPPAAVVALGTFGASRALPSLRRFVRDALLESLGGARQAGRALGTGAAAVLVLATVMATVVAYAVRPEFELELGSGEADLVARRFGAFDLDAEGVRFRAALPRAQLDLSDFGFGRRWRIEIRARSTGPVRGALAEVGTRTLETELGPEFRTYAFELPAPGRFGVGPVVRFPGLGGGRRLEIASVKVDRGRALPSMRPLLLAAGSVLLFLAALAASGIALRTAALGAGALTLLLALGLAFAPVVVTPSLPRLLAGAAAALLLALASRGALVALEARGLAPALAPCARAVASAAFLVWFLASASPLYAGGHFGYHTSIAEEIWQGKFLLYYFPGPENMLSRQPQWGNLVVPHPSFYHTMSSPLAALPRDAFHLATKLFLAALLFGSALAASLAATASGGPRAGVWAAAVVSGAPTGFQLLGLGHLMTIFGTFAAAAAFGFLAIQERNLLRRREFLLAAALVTFCFLSYTGSLLFGSVGLLGASVLLARDETRLSKRLAGLLVLGWTLALLLYYIHWVAPFFGETLPALLSGFLEPATGGGVPVSSRLARVPGKLLYTFGTLLFPLAGLAGIALARPRPRLVLLLGWALPLLLFSGLDPFFNFLLKHHYFSFPALAAGAGLALGWIERKRSWGWLISAGFLVYLFVMGFREAMLLARGLV